MSHDAPGAVPTGLPSLRGLTEKVAQRWNMLTPLMLQMGIIEDLLDRTLVLTERGRPGEASLTVRISSEGMAIEDGAEPRAHGHLTTTREQWRRIFAGEKTYATIFRFELEPERDAVPLHEMALVERFATVLHALVLLPLG